MSITTADFVRFDGVCSTDLASELRLQSVRQHYEVEYRETKDGGWVVRTIPNSEDEVALAGVGASLYEASCRLLRVVSFSRRIVEMKSDQSECATPLPNQPIEY